MNYNEKDPIAYFVCGLALILYKNDIEHDGILHVDATQFYPALILYNNDIERIAQASKNEATLELR